MVVNLHRLLEIGPCIKPVTGNRLLAPASRWNGRSTQHFAVTLLALLILSLFLALAAISPVEARYVLQRQTGFTIHAPADGS